MTIVIKEMMRMKTMKRMIKEIVLKKDDKAVYRKGFNDKVERNKAKDLESRFL